MSPLEKDVLRIPLGLDFRLTSNFFGTTIKSSTSETLTVSF